MVSKRFLLGMLVMALALGMTVIGCGDGSSSDSDKTPVVGDYDIGNLAQTEGSVTAVTIVPKSGKSTGAVTVKYDGSATLPSEEGTYAVTFDVAAATGWKKATGLSAGTLVISKDDGVKAAYLGLAIKSATAAERGDARFHVLYPGSTGVLVRFDQQAGGDVLMVTGTGGLGKGTSVTSSDYMTLYVPLADIPQPDTLRFHVNTGKVEVLTIFASSDTSGTGAVYIFDGTSTPQYIAGDSNPGFTMYWQGEGFAEGIVGMHYTISSTGAYKGSGAFGTPILKDFQGD